jgi:hypothetical protein
MFRCENRNNLEVSFNHHQQRDPLMETNSVLNLTKEYLSQKDIQKDVPQLFRESIQHNTEESL